MNLQNERLKPMVVFLIFCVTLLLFPVTIYFGTELFTEWYGIPVGIGMMLAAIPFHCLGKRHPLFYPAGILLNAVGNGFTVSAYYVMKNLPFQIRTAAMGLFPAWILLLMTCLVLLAFPKTKRITISIASALNVILSVALIILWARESGILFSFAFFCMVIAFFSLCSLGITFGNTSRPVLRDISFGSFGAFILLTIIVITVLSDGDILDGLDFDFLDFRRKKMKK